jgi:hypothetical protein
MEIKHSSLFMVVAALANFSSLAAQGNIDYMEYELSAPAKATLQAAPNDDAKVMVLRKLRSQIKSLQFKN